MPNVKLKIAAPRENPHICYVSREYTQKIKDLKNATGMSLYNLLCVCSGYLLNDKENIRKFREETRKKGFRNIGEWAECLIDLLHENLENVNQIDLSSVTIIKKEEK